MSSLLAIVTLGLMISYIILLVYICKHYYASMKTETKRITLLFASFNVSYLCRLIYEFLLGKKYYTAIIQERFARRIVGALMPLIFDLTSIIAILILHFISFRNGTKQKKINMPQAGHFNENGGLPDVDDDTVNQVLSQRASKTSVLLTLSCVDDYSEIEDPYLDA